MQRDEIPKEHSNHLGHSIQHILDAYNSAHETPHAPIFARLSVLRSNHTPAARMKTQASHGNTAHCLVNNLTIRIQLSDTEETVYIGFAKSSLHASVLIVTRFRSKQHGCMSDKDGLCLPDFKAMRNKCFLT